MSENQEINLEELFTKLEEVTNKLKDEELSLEDTFKLYKEGLSLAEACEKKIEKIECDIRVLEEGKEE